MGSRYTLGFTTPSWGGPGWVPERAVLGPSWETSENVEKVEKIALSGTPPGGVVKPGGKREAILPASPMSSVVKPREIGIEIWGFLGRFWGKKWKI